MKRKYYFNNLRIKRISYFYFTGSIIMAILYFLTFIPFLIVISIVTLFLGIHFYNKQEKVIIFEIRENKIFYQPKSDLGLVRLKDFYNLFINNRLNEMEISNIKNIEKTDSFLKGNSIFITNKNGVRIALLLSENKKQNNEIYSDLKKVVPVPKNGDMEQEDSSGIETITIENKDYKKEVLIEKTGNKTYTRTITTYSNTPSVKNKLLYTETIIAIVLLMKRLDDSLEIETLVKQQITDSNVDPNSLSNINTFIAQHSIEECIKFIKEKFKECIVEYTENTIEFIITTCLGPTKNQFFLNCVIESLIKDLLVVAGYGELGLDTTIAQLKT